MTYAISGRFNVTFETSTPESVDCGDFEDSGFIGRDLRLRDAINECGGFLTQDSGGWFDNHGFGHGTHDYFAYNKEETRSLHPPRNITPASYERLARLLGLRRRISSFRLQDAVP